MYKAIEKNARILAIFAMTCTAVVAGVHMFTKETIAKQEQQQLLATLNSIIAPDTYNNDLYEDCVLIHSEALGNDSLHPAYIAKMNDEPVAMAIKATAPDGYNGNIDLLIAIKVDGSISGVRVVKHNETPGLGDKIELRKSDWITSFTGKKMQNDKDSRWKVRKDGGMFDQFTGATITPRAIVKAVSKAIVYFNAHQEELFASTATCRGEE